ncbi:MAG: hypothetical protein V1904_07155 [Bacteroidota bacterium]
MKRCLSYLSFLSFLIAVQGFSQANIKDSVISTSLVQATYSFQFPGGDLSKKFVSNHAIGAGYLYKTRKNWIFGADGFFMFRDTVKETGILDSITTSDGNIIDGNGIFAEVHLYERGFHMGFKAGKLFPVWGPNKNSGIILLGGMGLLQHKIRIENRDNTASQITGDYKKGYDRLTNGLALSQFIGYMYLGNSKLVSFYAGIEIIEAFTQNRRSYNFDLMGPDNTNRLDLLYSIKVGWIIPLYKRSPDAFYYN